MNNYPDDVSPASFDRYWSDKLGPDTDEDPEDTIYHCDNCGDDGKCLEPSGDENHTVCCLCVRESAREFGPRDYPATLCTFCATRAHQE